MVLVITRPIIPTFLYALFTRDPVGAKFENRSSVVLDCEAQTDLILENCSQSHKFHYSKGKFLTELRQPSTR